MHRCTKSVCQVQATPPPLFGAQSVGVEDEEEDEEGVALEEILEGKLIIISPYMH